MNPTNNADEEGAWAELKAELLERIREADAGAISTKTVDKIFDEVLYGTSFFQQET